MKEVSVVRASAIAAAALFMSACGGSLNPQGLTPANPSALPLDTRSHILNRSGTSGDQVIYLSAANANARGVFAFSYPDGAYLGQLNQSFEQPAGLCADATGRIFAVDYTAQKIYEFAAGASEPSATLDDSGNYPRGCAVDPKTGDLAVSGGYTSSPGNVAVFKNAQGSPVVYQDANGSNLVACTYDNSGNVFVTSSSGINELHAGSESFSILKLDKEISGIGGVQWDGSALAASNPSTKRGQTNIKLYRIRVKANKGRVTQTVLLATGRTNRAAYGAPFWIQGNIVIAPRNYKRDIGIWGYPEGGQRTGTIKESLSNPTGIAISRSNEV